MRSNLRASGIKRACFFRLFRLDVIEEEHLGL